MAVELSLDIAMGNLGWVFFDGSVPILCGVVRPRLDPKKKMSVREQNVCLIEYMAKEVAVLLRENAPVLVVGEAPTGGARNASAAIKMNMALAVVCSVCSTLGVLYRWCSPSDVKRVTVGSLTASKEEIMDWAIARYGGAKRVVDVKIQKGRLAGQIAHRASYQFLGTWHPAGVFEHIADACGAYEAITSRMKR